MSALTFFFWVALTLGAGWFSFPFSRRVFADALPDAGLAVGRILFLAIWTLLAFYAGQLGVPVAVSAWLYAVLALGGLVLWWRDRAVLGATWRSQRRALVTVESVFVTVFLIFFLLRGVWSDTNGNNGEKGMDGALIASLTRAQKLPPPNPYAAGARLQSYYYFGHLETALLTRASGTTVRWSYNLMCATLPALCFAALFSLGAGLTGRLKGGAWVTGAVFLSGTLQPIYQWSQWSQWNWREPLPRLDAFGISRVLPYSINEFPWFTFNQADLHAHYFNFPFQLALMALAWQGYRTKRPVVAGLATLILGAQIVTNTWDFPVYWLLFALSLVIFSGETLPGETSLRAKLAGEFGGEALKGEALDRKALDRAVKTRWRRVQVALGARHVAVALGVALGALILAAPFLLNVRSAAAPPRPLQQPASPLREWLLLWGPITLGWWTFAALAIFRRSAAMRAALAVGGALVLFAAWRSDWQVPSPLVLPLIGVCLGLSLWGTLFLCGAERFLCLMALCGLLALGWSETTWAGFLGDPHHLGFDDYKRQDTVFKFGLQSWMLWGTASAAGVWLTLVRGSQLLKTAAVAIAVPLAAVMLWGNLAFMFYRSRLPEVSKARRFDAWDGWAHLAPPEKMAAAWLQENAAPGQNIVEAARRQGGDFSEFTRYAHATGIPTIVGPLAHTFYWSPANAPMGRGQSERDAKIASEWAEVGRRQADVREIYSPADLTKRAQLLQRYGVKFLVWGELERREYGEEVLQYLASSLNIAAQFGDPNDPHHVLIFRAP